MFEQTFKNIDDILHKDAGCTSELDYTEQSSWLLFLKYLDALEGKRYSFILDAAYQIGDVCSEIRNKVQSGYDPEQTAVASVSVR